MVRAAIFNHRRDPISKPMPPRAPWQLPPGVPSGVWEYAQSEEIAEGYDEYFALHPLFEIDEGLLHARLSPPGPVVDLGCGTGRALLPLARRGFTTVGVDLSQSMLRIVAQKAAHDGVRVHGVRANLAELSCFQSGVFECAICLFSTLGMIRGRRHRDRFLGQVRRMLRPGGRFIVHVHNLWSNLLTSPGRRWLVPHLLQATIDRRIEWGDKFFSYRGVPRMFLHTFRRRELLADLHRAGFVVEELFWLDAGCRGRLRRPWLFGGVRASGWIAVCRATEASSPGRP